MVKNKEPDQSSSVARPAANPEGKDAQEQNAQPRKHRTMEEWQALVNDRLEEAIERGDFDNLPGKGKPLRLDDNPNEPSDMRMANRLLKNNELSPAWVGDRRALIAEGDRLRADIKRQWTWHSETYAGERSPERQAEIAASWAKRIEAWEEPIAELNRRILDLNLTLPIWRLELMRFNLDRELRSINARRRFTENE